MNLEDNPYAPPQMSDAPAPRPDLQQRAGRVASFSSNSGLSLVVAVMLGVSALLEVVWIGSTLLQIDLLSRAMDGGIGDEEAVANDLRQQFVALSQFVVLVITGMCFMTWMYRAHRNLPALQASNVEYGSGWAIGAWFVPFLNLFRPYQMMQEIWRGSDPHTLAGGRYLRNFGGSSLVGWWWGLWIGLGIANRLSSRTSTNPTLDVLLMMSWFDIVCSFATIVCAVLAIAIVRGIDANQEERVLALNAMPVGVE